MKTLVFLFILLLSGELSAFELKSHLIPSFLTTGRNELILNSHSTALLQFGFVSTGPYLGYEYLNGDAVDTAYGWAFRLGETNFLEFQGGYLDRKFESFHGTQKGSGFVINLLFGSHLSKTFDLSLLLSAKRLTSGELEKRWIIKILPYLGMRVSF